MRNDKSTFSSRLASGALMLCVTCLIGCQNSVELPEEVSGTYVTKHPTYDDRSFTLTPENFLVHIDADDTIRYPIREIYLEPNGQGPHSDLYTLVYSNKRGQEFKLRFYLEPDTRQALVFSNQPEVIWTKEDGAL